MMIYPDFVCQCTGAKDTWGANGVQIQGEDGYIFVAGSTNESGPVKVVTKVSEKIYVVQPDGNQWYYEFQSLDRLFYDGDMERCKALMQATLDTAWVLEEGRKSAAMDF